MKNYHRTKCKFTASCTAQKIPARTTHVSESKARQAIDFYVLNVPWNCFGELALLQGSRTTWKVGPHIHTVLPCPLSDLVNSTSLATLGYQ